ncbi:hypothetical protein MKW92_040313 [Papaver armeniacum]|nr:hypothetical protein MKW92_040313 [Papaver armeniacum]
MAEALVTFFLQRLNDFILKESNLLTGVDKEIKLLQNELEWMRLFIKNADVRADTEVKLTVNQIRELTFNAEDVIDEFILRVYRHGHPRNGLCAVVGSFKSCICSIRKIRLLHELGSQITEINTMSEKISANKSKYVIEGGESSKSSYETTFVMNRHKVKRAPIAEEWDVVGIEDSTKQVKSLLMERGDGKQHLAAVAIVGMGGLGKTTLAKKVCNSTDVQRHFDCFAWVYVSQEYRLKELLQSILKCITTISREELEKLDVEESRKMLRACLQGGKKYLIVLDDMWNIEAWDDLNPSFPDEMNGSRILLTTRNKHVALYADSSSNNIHELRSLNKMESWELFTKKIFLPAGRGEGCSNNQEYRCPLELQDLGNQMVEKCRGLPLAIVVLGSLLSSKEKSQIVWFKVNASVNWHLTHGVGSHSCAGILALSYYELPYYLKPCFLYMGIFPEDQEIKVYTLFSYWIAEGFIQTRGEQTMEDVAEDYLEELISRSMIQVGKWKFDGRVKSCRIHDLLRDLCIEESKNDQFLRVCGSNDDFTKSLNIRRLIIHGNGDGTNNEKQFISEFHGTPNIRSFMCVRKSVNEKQFWRYLCRGFKLLRVLELVEVKNLRILPKDIGELIHLKYLGLCETNLERLSNSLGKLVNLQTLNLQRCHLENMAGQISNLHQLRRLYVLYTEPYDRTILDKCLAVSYVSHLRIDNLRDLQSLVLDAGPWIHGDALGKLSMLKKLRIRGSLIPYKEVISDSIAKLSNLRSMELWNCEEVPTLIQSSQNDCLNKLHLNGRLSLEKLTDNTEFWFPPNLHKLTLMNSHMENDPMVILEKLPNLEILMLHYNSYVGKKLVCSQEGFPRLQLLKLCGLMRLEEWTVEEGALSRLTHLRIYTCKRLETLPDGLRQLTSLQELELYNLTHRFIGRLTKNVGEDWDKIKHIPSLSLK